MKQTKGGGDMLAVAAAKALEHQVYRRKRLSRQNQQHIYRRGSQNFMSSFKALECIPGHRRFDRPCRWEMSVCAFSPAVVSRVFRATG